MAIIIQFLVLLLIVISTVLVISIPVIFASPGQWEKSKNLIFTVAGLWGSLVIITGILNSFIT